MNVIPNPIRVAAIAAAVVLPFSIGAAGTLLFTSGLGAMIHADYVHRHQRVRLPRARKVQPPRTSRAPLCRESNQLAA